MSFWAPLDRVALGREMAGLRRHCMVTVGTGLLLPRAGASVLCFQGLSLPWVRLGGLRRVSGQKGNAPGPGDWDRSASGLDVGSLELVFVGCQEGDVMGRWGDTFPRVRTASLPKSELVDDRHGNYLFSMR